MDFINATSGRTKFVNSDDLSEIKIISMDMNTSNTPDGDPLLAEKTLGRFKNSVNGYEKKTESDYIKNKVAAMLDTLKEPERELISLSFGLNDYNLPMSDLEISRRLNLSIETVQRRKNVIFEKLRKVAGVKSYC